MFPLRLYDSGMTASAAVSWASLSGMDAPTRGGPENGWSEPLWGRQDGESDKAFQAFALYRDLGPARSTQQVAHAVSS
jgi:hypothetical protein